MIQWWCAVADIKSHKNFVLFWRHLSLSHSVCGKAQLIRQKINEWELNAAKKRRRNNIKWFNMRVSAHALEKKCTWRHCSNTVRQINEYDLVNVLQIQTRTHMRTQNEFRSAFYQYKCITISCGWWIQFESTSISRAFSCCIPSCGVILYGAFYWIFSYLSHFFCFAANTSVSS